MEERLKKLKTSMQKNTFHQLNFNDTHKHNIYKKIKEHNTGKEDLYLAIFQLLREEKTGVELLKYLRGRGVQNFEENEGFLYSVLHQLENKGYLKSRWDENQFKYYSISEKGQKLLRKAEKERFTNRFTLKHLLERYE
ncbi:PadR family transcriptional regulator [Metabacillus fastidiosus]